MLDNYPDIANKVKESISYIDRVDMWITEELSGSDEDILGRLGKYQMREIEKKDFLGDYRKRLILYQPSIELLRWLHKRLFNRIFICFTRLEIALDLICEDLCDVRDVKEFIDLHLIQLWRRNSYRVVFKDTTYYKEGSSRNNIAVYKRERGTTPTKLTKRDEYTIT